MLEFYPGGSFVYIFFAIHLDVVRCLLGSRFNDWFELVERLNMVFLMLPKNSVDIYGHHQVSMCGMRMLNFPKDFNCKDFLSLTMKVGDIDPRFAHHILSMIHQILFLNPNLFRYMEYLIRITPNYGDKLLLGANQFVVRKDVWEFLRKLCFHLICYESVPRQKISPLMHSRKLGFVTFPLEMSVNSDYLRKKRRLRLLCLSGIMEILLRDFFRMTSDGNTYQLIKGIKKFLDEKQRRLLK